MIDEKYYTDHSNIYFENPDSDSDRHIVKKGMFMEDDCMQTENIVITLCFKYNFTDDSEIEEFDAGWRRDWLTLGGCEECLKTYTFMYGVELENEGEE